MAEDLEENIDGASESLRDFEESSQFSKENVEGIAQAAKILEGEFGEIRSVVNKLNKDLKDMGEAPASVSKEFGILKSTASTLSIDVQNISSFTDSAAKFSNKQKEASAAIKNIEFEKKELLETQAAREQDINNKRSEQQDLSKIIASSQSDIQLITAEINAEASKGAIANQELIASLQEQLQNEGTLIQKSQQKVSLLDQQTDGAQEVVDKIKEQVENLNNVTETGKELVDVLGQAAKEAAKMDKSTKFFGLMSDFMGSIPGLSAFAGPFKAAQTAAREALEDGGTSMKAFGAGLKALIPSFTTMIVAFTKGVMDLDKTTTQFAKTMGMSKEAAKGIADEFRSAGIATDNINMSVKNLQMATLELGETMGAVSGFTKEEVALQVELTKQFGLQGAEAANLAKLGKLNGQNGEEVAVGLADQVVQLQKETGIQLNLNKLTKELANTSAGLQAQFGFNTKELAKAVVKANALGLELEQTKNIASGLLDFESSISAELEAELLTGKQLNLEQARLAALTGDSAEAARLMLEQLGGAAEFASMNVLQQEKLAQALNMNRDELAGSLRDQEVLSQLGVESLEQLKEEGRLEELNSSEAGKQLYQQQLQQDLADKFAAAMEKLQQALVTIVDGPFGTMLEYMASFLGSTVGMTTAFTLLGVLLGGKIVMGFVTLIKYARILRGLKIGGAIADAFGAAMSSPASIITGGIAGLAIGAALTAGIFAAVGKADDFAQLGDLSTANLEQGNYGKRALIEKGEITLFNNDDDILAGTDIIDQTNLSDKAKDRDLSSPNQNADLSERVKENEIDLPDSPSSSIYQTPIGPITPSTDLTEKIQPETNITSSTDLSEKIQPETNITSSTDLSEKTQPETNISTPTDLSEKTQPETNINTLGLKMLGLTQATTPKKETVSSSFRTTKMDDGKIDSNGSKTFLNKDAITPESVSTKPETTLTRTEIVSIEKKSEKPSFDFDYNKLAKASAEGSKGIAEAVSQQQGLIVFDDTASRSKSNNRGIFMNNLKNSGKFI